MISLDITFLFQIINLLILVGLVGGTAYIIIKLVKILRKANDESDQEN